MEKTPIRVLMVVGQMNRAGIESRLMDLYRRVDHEKVQFDFYTLHKEKGQFDDEILALGGKIYYTDPLSVKKLCAIPKRFERFCRSHPEYKIIHAHMNQWCGLILKGAKRAGVPIRIAHARTSLEKTNIKNIVKNLVKIPTNRYANYKLAVSDKAGEWLYGKKAVSRGEVLYWKNSIQVEDFAYSPELRAKKREELSLGDSFTLLHVGNLRREKNHPYLFRVFAEVLKQHSNSKLVLVGRDQSEGQLPKLAQDLGIYENILFLGSRSDVAELLQVGDVFVFPSFYEGFPTSVLEAQAAGLPCVISDRITKEVMVTPLVEMRSIDENPFVWAEHVLKKRETTRLQTGDLIVKAGHSLSDFVVNTQTFYLSEVKRMK